MLLKTVNKNRGFTLVELMVSVSVFAIIMTISMGSILSVFDANRKSQSLRAVMDNMNFTLEAMTRTIRFGTHYHCNISVVSPPLTSGNDCGFNSTADSIDVKTVDKLGVAHQVIYKRAVVSGKGRIARTVDGGTDYYLTSSDVDITKLSFNVFGSPAFPDPSQPQVIIVISGFAGSKATSQSKFSLETTVSQRLFDSQ